MPTTQQKKGTMQSRTICGPTPPMRAIVDLRQRQLRRLCFASRVLRTSFRSVIASKSRFRPDEGRQLSFTQVRHNLGLTQFLVAARRWAKHREDFALPEVRICYDLAAVAGQVEIGGRGKREQVAVIPDAWLLFERQRRGASPNRFPVLLEVDRGTMYKERIKKHVGARIEFVRGGGYKKLFGTAAATIAYVAIGEEGRRETLASWTRELLKEEGRESWSKTFRFGRAPLEEMYEAALFDRQVWYRSDQDAPVGLFEG